MKITKIEPIHLIMPKGLSHFEFHVTELPDLIKYFEKLLDKKRIKQIYASSKISIGSEHFWYKYIKAYRRWNKGGSRIEKVSKDIRLIEFSGHINAIKTYEDDWNFDEGRNEIVKRLSKSDETEGMLFEFHAGLHFLQQGLEVHWIPDINDEKRADLEIIAPNKEKLLIECTFRQRSFARVLMDTVIVKDLLKSARNKLESKHDYGLPRIVIVKIPEEIKWQNEAIREDIDIMVSNWYKVNKLNSVNALLFMGFAPMARVYVGKGPIKQVAFEPDQKVYIHRNPNPRYHLPSGINLVSKM